LIQSLLKDPIAARITRLLLAELLFIEKSSELLYDIKNHTNSINKKNLMMGFFAQRPEKVKRGPPFFI
jgi:hypothetical protein